MKGRGPGSDGRRPAEVADSPDLLRCWGWRVAVSVAAGTADASTVGEFVADWEVARRLAKPATSSPSCSMSN